MNLLQDYMLIGGPFDGGTAKLGRDSAHVIFPRSGSHGYRIDVYERRREMVGRLQYAGRFRSILEYRRKTVKK